MQNTLRGKIPSLRLVTLSESSARTMRQEIAPAEEMDPSRRPSLPHRVLAIHTALTGKAALLRTHHTTSYGTPTHRTKLQYRVHELCMYMYICICAESDSWNGLRLLSRCAICEEQLWRASLLARFEISFWVECRRTSKYEADYAIRNFIRFFGRNFKKSNILGIQLVTCYYITI